MSGVVIKLSHLVSLQVANLWPVNWTMSVCGLVVFKKSGSTSWRLLVKPT